MIVIATYNEAATIDELLTALGDDEVVVVDDSSPDGTGDLARKHPHVTVITRPPKSGIASAYIEGFQYVLDRQAEWIVQMDAGFTHSPFDAKRMLKLAQETRADLTIGERQFTFKGKRTLLSWSARVLMGFIGVHRKDVTSGFRVWRGQFLRTLPLSAVRSKGFAFQLELLWMAEKSRANINTVPIEYRLTNSSLKWWMVSEAIGVWYRMYVAKSVSSYAR